MVWSNPNTLSVIFACGVFTGYKKFYNWNKTEIQYQFQHLLEIIVINTQLIWKTKLQHQRFITGTVEAAKIIGMKGQKCRKQKKNIDVINL